MRQKYQPKHMKEVDRMKLPLIPVKPFVTAGIAGVMIAQTALTPAAAIAANLDARAAEGAASVVEAGVDTSFSTATQRLIAAASGEAKMTLDEAKQLLAAVRAQADAAAGADAQQQKVVEQAQQTVTSSQQAATAADAAVTAELQAQADALRAQLEQAKADAAAAEQAKAAAEAELETLTGDKEAAEKDAAAKQTALDEANAALEQAKKDLQDFLDGTDFDEMTAERDEAQAAYEKAFAAQQDAQAAYDEANQTLTDLQSQLADKQAELEAVKADLPAKQQAAKDAAAKLENAQAGYASAVEDIKGELVADEKAALENAQAAYDEAVSDDDPDNDAAALEALNTAQAAYDDAVASAGAQAEAEANQAIANAQAAKDAADADLKACEDTIATAPGEIKAIEDQISTEQAKVTEAQKAAGDAAQAADDAQQKLTEAQSKLDNATDAQQEWDEKAKPLQDAVTAAQTAVTTAQGELDAANQAVKDAQAKVDAKQEEIDALKEQAGDAVTQAVDGFEDFLVWLYGKTYNEADGTSACSNALGYLAYALGGGWGFAPPTSSKTGERIDEFTHPGEATDATAIENILLALDMIDQLNAIRRDEQLPELKVSLFGMVQAAYHANWSARTYTFNHAALEGFGMLWPSGENAAWGYTAQDGLGDAFTGWYYQEKANATGQAQTDPTTNYTYQPQPGGQTGHYENIINKNYMFTGMAYTPAGLYGSTAVNDFQSGFFGGKPYVQDDVTNSRYFDTDTIYTTEELRDLIAQAQSERVQKYTFAADGHLVFINNDTLDKLEAEYEELHAKLTDAQANATAKQQAYDGAVAAKEEADAALAEIGPRPTIGSLQQDVDNAQKALDEAKADKAEAEQKLAQVTAEVNRHVEELDAQKQELQAKLDQANADREGLATAAQDAQTKLDAARNKYSTLTDASDTLEAARATADETAKALEDATALRDSLETAIPQLEADITAQQATVDPLKAELDAANDDEDSAKGVLDAAQAKLDAANGAKAAFEAAREDAEATVTEATEAKKAADQIVVNLGDQIEEQKQAIVDAEASKDAADADIATWQAVFAQQAPESIVTDGFSGTTDDADVAALLAAAHLSYQDKLDLLAEAEAKLQAAEEALAAAKADKQTTADERVAAEAEYAAAKDAYDKLATMLAPEEQPMKQAVAKVDGLPQTGDPAALAAAGMALAGAAALAGGAHFRRRRSE